MLHATKWYTDLSKCIISTLSTIILLYLIFGFFFEGYEKLNAGILYGAVCDHPTDEWFNEALFLQIPVIAYAGEIFSDIPIYGFWHLVVLFLYLNLWFLLFVRILTRMALPRFYIWLYSYLLVLGLAGFSLIYVNFTRDAILLVSSSMILYLDIFNVENKKKYPLLFLFAIGLSMRLSAGLLTFILISVFYLISLKKFKLTLEVLFFPLIIASLFLAIVLVYKFASNNKGIKIEQNSEYALCDRNAIMPESTMLTHADSMRYRALSQHFLVTDSAQITLNFINRVIDHDKYLAWGINNSDFEHLTQTLLPLLTYNVLLLIGLYLWLIINMIGLKTQLWVDILILHIFGWIVIVLFGMKINMFPHFLLPWLSTLFLLSFYLVFTHKRVKLFIQLPAILVLYIAFVSLRNISKQENRQNELASNYLERINDISKRYIPIIWFNQMDYLPSQLLMRQELDVLKKSHYFNLYFMTYYSFAQQRTLDEFGFSQLDWVGMNRKLKSNSGRIRILTDERMATFLQEYYAEIYGMEFILKKDEVEKEVVDKIFVYKLAP